MWSRFRFQGEKSRQTQQKSGSVMQATEKADLWTEESDSEATKVRTAQFLVFKTLEDAGKGLPAALEKMKADKIEGSGEGVLILTLMEMDAGFTDEEATSQLLSKFLQERKGGLAAANVGRVTVALNHSGKPVDYFTFFSRFTFVLIFFFFFFFHFFIFSFFHFFLSFFSFWSHLYFLAVDTRKMTY